ncbi:low temperature requirement protein A [Micromonospora sp. NBC_01796]|uniref:low temperature requirement protein A n=1 Tax=Micromonospora sp. NBC_01796 TaxID=2975987 RepID=UPI002DDAF1B3|nr:low temperature requirement protein A [Micromonospora sp. NBC_01796]WSA87873.1 low temperature requirement protein A [Micromonospora sp. NBC_01796]
MDTDQRSDLLRDLGQPKGVTYIELFFDLVFVFTLFRLSQTLMAHLDWVGAFQTLILLMAVWWVWSYTNLLTDTLDSRLIRLQFLITATMFGILVTSTAIPEAFEERGLLFAIAYVAINLGRSSILAFALRHHHLGRRPLRGAVWFAVSAVPWFAGAMVEDAGRLALWSLALAIDYVAALVGWPVPGLGRTSSAEWNLADEHMAERYRLFVIIALGETVAITGRTFHDSDFSLHRGTAFTLSFCITVSLYWIYFHRTREKLGPAFSGASDPADGNEPRSRSKEAALAHLIMVMGVVGITVADELVIRHPTGSAPASWVAAMLGGPALFLAGHALLGRQVFTRAATPRLVGLAVLIVASPAMVGLAPLASTGLAAAVLAVVVGFEIRLNGPLPGARSLPPRG